MKKWGAVGAVIILAFLLFGAWSMSRSYAIERTVIDLPSYEIQPVRSYGEWVSDYD